MVKKSQLISPDWPFAVKKSPVFYGWVIWVFSTLGFLMSIPGQTMGMAVFTDHLIDALGLTRTQLSLAYLIGTVASSLFLTAAGRYYDRFGGRFMIVLSSLALAFMLVYIAYLDRFRDWFVGLPFSMASITFVLLVVGYFGVRFFGQGVLTSSSRNILLEWFDKKRGFVGGVRGVFVSLGFSLAPLLLAALIAFFTWRQSLLVMAAVLAFGFALLALVFLRDRPEDCGLLPDGENPDRAQSNQAASKRSYTLAQARLTPVFWIYSLGLSIHALFGTALTFHVVSIFAEAGRDQSQAFSYFLPAAVVSTSVNLLSSWQADKYPLKPFLIVMLIGFILGAFGLLNLSQDWGYWTLAIGFGLGGGLWGLLSNLAFVRFFGRGHLGEISGLNTALTVFASAIGPAMFSLGLDFFGSYAAPIYCCIAVLVLLLISAIMLKQEEIL